MLELLLNRWGIIGNVPECSPSPALDATACSRNGRVPATPECNATTLTIQTPRKRNPVREWKDHYAVDARGGDNFLRTRMQLPKTHAGPATCFGSRNGILLQPIEKRLVRVSAPTEGSDRLQTARAALVWQLFPKPPTVKDAGCLFLRFI